MDRIEEKGGKKLRTNKRVFFFFLSDQCSPKRATWSRKLTTRKRSCFKTHICSSSHLLVHGVNNPQFTSCDAAGRKISMNILASAAGCAATWQSFVSFAACGQLVVPVCLYFFVLLRNGGLSLLLQEPGDHRKTTAQASREVTQQQATCPISSPNIHV